MGSGINVKWEKMDTKWYVQNKSTYVHRKNLEVNTQNVNSGYHLWVMVLRGVFILYTVDIF